jgi:TfoX/Sxy family transcriptional regulator of competence genes
MPYDLELAQRIRACLPAGHTLVEKKMFGGVAFMLSGNMLCGVVKDSLMLRVGKDAAKELLEKPHARPMDFTGKPMQAMIYVEPEGCSTDRQLSAWIEHAIAFVETLPPK